MPSFTEQVMLLVIGGALVILGKIVWNFLSRRQENALCAERLVRIRDLEQKMEDHDTRIGKIETRIEERLNTFEKKFDRGTSKFDGMASELTTISKTLARLEERIG